MDESNHKVSVENRGQGRQGDQRGQAGGIAEELGKGGKGAQGNEGEESGQQTKKNQRETEEGRMTTRQYYMLMAAVCGGFASLQPVKGINQIGWTVAALIYLWLMVKPEKETKQKEGEDEN